MRCQLVYSVIDFLIVTASISKLLHSWLLIDLSEHHYTALTSKFNNFFNRSSMMLNNVFNVENNRLCMHVLFMRPQRRFYMIYDILMINACEYIPFSAQIHCTSCGYLEVYVFIVLTIESNFYNQHLLSPRVWFWNWCFELYLEMPKLLLILVTIKGNMTHRSANSPDLHEISSAGDFGH